MTPGEKMYAARHAKRVVFRELAEKTGLSPARLSAIERDTGPAIMQFEAAAICAALDLPPYIWDGKIMNEQFEAAAKRPDKDAIFDEMVRRLEIIDGVVCSLCVNCFPWFFVESGINGALIGDDDVPDLSQVELPDLLRRAKDVQNTTRDAILSRALVVLKAVEWAGHDSNFGWSCCPVCFQQEADGHAPDCDLAAALRGE